MDELIATGASITDVEVSKLYKEIPNTWVLLEPVEIGKNDKAVKVRLLKYDKDKEVLRDHLLDQDDFETLIYFYTGDDGKCKI